MANPDRKDARKIAKQQEQAEKRKGSTSEAMRERAKLRKAERKRIKAEAKAKAAESEIGAVYYGNPTPKNEIVYRSRKLTREQKIAEIKAQQKAKQDRKYDKLVAKWTRKLTREGWQETPNGWVKDQLQPLKIEDAVVIRNKQKREEKMGFDEKASAYLLSKGWKTSGVNNNVWSVQIGDNMCYRTLRRAYKVQMWLDSNG